MTINREMHPVKVLIYTEQIDTYGQKRQGEAKIVFINAAIYPYSTELNGNPTYKDVTNTAFVEKPLNEKDEIEDGGTVYLIEKALPAGRYTQLLLKKK